MQPIDTVLNGGNTARVRLSLLDLAGQKWYGRAVGLVLMTAVLRRPQWKYQSAHVYRAALIEAGHLRQTFRLVATWLGLAPFCSMALVNSRIESNIGIDGVSESVLYATGVGTPPHCPKWAPWPTGFPGSRYQNPSFSLDFFDGGGVWKSNPPFDPRRAESPALKAGKITGPFSPPLL